MSLTVSQADVLAVLGCGAGAVATSQAMVLQMTIAAIDRGAGIANLSQYSPTTRGRASTIHLPTQPARGDQAVLPTPQGRSGRPPLLQHPAHRHRVSPQSAEARCQWGLADITLAKNGQSANPEHAFT